jgi:hypothetical protein
MRFLMNNRCMSQFEAWSLDNILYNIL